MSNMVTVPSLTSSASAWPSMRWAPVNYPSLYKVANTRKRSVDGMFRDYKTTKESLSQFRDREIETALPQPPVKKRMISQEDAEGLKEVFRVSDEDLKDALRGPGGITPSRFEDILALLTEALWRSEQQPPSQN